MGMNVSKINYIYLYEIIKLINKKFHGGDSKPSGKSVIRSNQVILLLRQLSIQLSILIQCHTSIFPAFASQRQKDW